MRQSGGWNLIEWMTHWYVLPFEAVFLFGCLLTASMLKGNEDVQALAKEATGMVKTALKTFTDQPSNGA